MELEFKLVRLDTNLSNARHHCRAADAQVDCRWQVEFKTCTVEHTPSRVS